MLTEEVDRNRVDWKKWVLGPYRVLLQSETYKTVKKMWRTRKSACMSSQRKRTSVMRSICLW